MKEVEFDIKLPGKEQGTVSVKATGSEEDLKYFEDKVALFFKNGASFVRHTNQKLNEELVRDIKRIHKEKGWGRVRLARKFHVGKTTIEKILNGETWKDVEV